MLLKSASRYLVFLAIALLSFSSFAQQGPLSLVPTVDPVRYSGLWYEVARFPQFFENNLVGVTAKYEIRADGRIDVTNAGFKGTLDGPPSVVHAIARVPDPGKPAALKVKFFGLFEADYLIFGLDEVGYSWALVGDNSRKQLWFLSRTATLGEATLARMRELTAASGYDLSKLVMVPQR
ncbi:MAG: lipocalin family protein [Rectinemataceae bacterium]